MDLKLWEYIFEMFNYKIRQKKIDFFKITNPYPALKAGRPSARNYEALSKTRYNSVHISNCGLKFLQYILNTLYFRVNQKKKISIFSTQVTRLLP